MAVRARVSPPRASCTPACSARSDTTYALRFASSTVLAPLHYLELISATFFGYVVFSDFPDLPTWIGVAVIAASGIYIMHRERVTARGVAVTVAPLGPAP